MNKRLKFPLVCLLFLSLTNLALAESNLTQLVKKIQPSIVTIQTYNKNTKPLGQGTGFFTDFKTIITNYHVLMGAHEAEIITHDGRKYPIKQVVAENKKMDLLKLSVDIPQSSVSRVNLARSLPSIAESIVVIGSPYGLEQTISEGIISSVRDVPNVGKLLQISAPISRGSSGSPVLNMKGEVVGIVSFYFLGGQNLNFAIPTQYLLDLKPSETFKTISDWSGKDVCGLYVHTEPEGARVRILNIKPKFFQGIVLKPGWYHIEVTADGYEMEKKWIKIDSEGDKNLLISLRKSPDLPSNAPPELVGIGTTYWEKGEYKKVLELIKQSVRNNPDDAWGHYGLGSTYAMLGLYKEAVNSYKQAIRLKPDYARAHCGLGTAYYGLGLQSPQGSLRKLNFYNQAIHELKLTLQLSPDDETAYGTYICLGECQSYLQHGIEAIWAYKQAIQIKPNNALAYCRLGFAYHDSGDTSSALNQYKILKNIDKEQANILFNYIYE